MALSVDIDVPSKLRDILEVRPKVMNLLSEKFDVNGKPYAPFLCYNLDYNTNKVIVFFVKYDVAENRQREKYEDGDAFIEVEYSDIDAFNSRFGPYETYRVEIEKRKREQQQAINKGWETATRTTAETGPAKIISKFAGLGRKRLTRKRRSNRK